MRLIATLAVCFWLAVSHAQKVTEPVDLNARDPRLQEGKLFVVRLFPILPIGNIGGPKGGATGTSLEVEISGKKAAIVKIDDLGIEAKAFIGDRVIDLSPKQVSKRPLRFRFESIDLKESKLEMKVKTPEGQEKFEFNDLR